MVLTFPGLKRDGLKRDTHLPTEKKTEKKDEKKDDEKKDSHFLEQHF